MKTSIVLIMTLLVAGCLSENDGEAPNDNKVILQRTLSSCGEFTNGATAEEYLDVTSNWAVVGVGLSSHNGDISEIRLTAVDLDDSTFNTEDEFNIGDGTTETYGHVPTSKKYVVTGIGAREHNGDIKTLRLYYREWSPSQNKLLGDEYFVNFGTQPTSDPERIARIIDWYPYQEDWENGYVSGIGAKSHNGDITGITLGICNFQ